MVFVSFSYPRGPARYDAPAGAVQHQPQPEETHAYMRQELARLPEELLSLDASEPYPVQVSRTLVDCLEKLEGAVAAPQQIA
jgi:hypothetical protein